LGEAVVVKVTITVDSGWSRGAVGVEKRVVVRMRVVGSAVGAVEVMVMAVSESGAWGLRLVSEAEASAAAKARAKMVEWRMLVLLALRGCRSVRLVNRVKECQDEPRWTEGSLSSYIVMVMV
jgi:hypothetical protein